MKEGMTCTMEAGAGSRLSGLPDALGVALLYAALLGGVCRMAGLSPVSLLPLLPGLIPALAGLVPRRGRALLLVGGLILAVGVAAIQFRSVLDGVFLLLNRLCQASQARQSYAYTLFPVSAPAFLQPYCLGCALAVLGLLTGSACGAAAVCRAQWAYLLLLLALGGAGAYLGISPGAGWLLLLALALALTLRGRGSGRGELPSCIAVLVVVALIWGGVTAVFPGENAALSAWEEGVRDSLALHTTARVEEQVPRPEQTPEEEPEEQSLREESAGGILGEDGPVWLKPPPVLRAFLLLVLLLLALLVAGSRLKKRRAKNRQGLDDPEEAAAIRCMFLYAMRWLRAGGLPEANTPFSAWGEQVEAVFTPELRASFEAVLPLWQEAAYSGHQMDGEQRERMRSFLEAARQAAWSSLGLGGRFRARYLEGL